MLRDTKRIAASIDFLQKDVNELSSFLFLDQRIQNFISPRPNFTKYYLEPLASLLASKDYISFIILYSFEGDKYYFSNDNSTGVVDFEQLKSTELYKQILKNKGAPMWLSLNNLPLDLIIKNNYPKIAMAKLLLDWNTYEPAGILVICINIPTIERIYMEDLKEKEACFFITDNHNKIISFTSTSPQFTPQFAQELLKKYLSDEQNRIITANSSKLLITSSYIPTSNWRLVSVVSLENAINTIRNSFVLLYVRILILCLVFAFIISMYFSSMLTLPLQKLVNSMKKVREGNLREQVNIPSHANDEITILVTEYNSMVEKINELINKVLKLEIHKKEAELKALEAQINPHFLYNTLDTIFWKAEKAHDSDLSEMIYSLSRLFRLTLNRGSEFIQIKGEKELIEHYLFLQSKRYKNRLKYSIDISPEILNYSIPKLILQPFVENAIVHGMENNTNQSIIEIIGKKEGEYLCFIIKDNGIGMSKQQLEELKALLNSGKESNLGYAIKNVNERLKLYYENDYKLTIHSEPGKGTEVKLTLPINCPSIEIS
ncbi:two-component system sensor histidine kinase YesM [Thermoanaerobacter pentosaceus]|uniref:Two-component system sensor histidine kinase YesM n=1 Tax=Thermoanaerobacter pentosaceus TaxID=694059 RepID=A0ABT9M212_9THEO|nr:two-component system sensor histidine kinase YesM [Thermoanaerobacter pentosaceus]